MREKAIAKNAVARRGATSVPRKARRREDVFSDQAETEQSSAEPSQQFAINAAHNAIIPGDECLLNYKFENIDYTVRVVLL